jgi:hypothetical protein
VDPTCLPYLEKPEPVLCREAEQAKTRKHVLNGATSVPLVKSTFVKHGPAAEGYLQYSETVTVSTGVVDSEVAYFLSKLELCPCAWSWQCFLSLIAHPRKKCREGLL